MRLNQSGDMDAYPISVEAALDIVDTIRTEVPAEVRTAISAAYTPFAGDVAGIHLSPESCLRMMFTIPLALTHYNNMVEAIVTRICVCLPMEFCTPFFRYRGVSAGSEQGSDMAVLVCAREVPLVRELGVNDTLANLAGALKPCDRRKVYAWSILYIYVHTE